MENFQQRNCEAYKKKKNLGNRNCMWERPDVRFFRKRLWSSHYKHVHRAKATKNKGVKKE